MNSGKMDSFVLVVAAMSEKMVEQAAALLEAEEHLNRHHEQLDARARTISDLKEEIATLYEQRDRLSAQVRDLLNVAREHDLLKGSYAQAREEADKLRQEKAKWERGLQGLTDAQACDTYMKNEGEAKWEFNKIGVVNVIRSLTGWSVGVAREWCDAYIGARQSEKEQKKGEEESGPHTKRSSQIPPGVGTNVRKSPVSLEVDMG